MADDPNKKFNVKRRDFNDRIKGLIKNQKPACKVIIYSWDSPEIVGLEVLNLNNSGGDYFNNASKRKLARTGSGLSVIDNDIVRCNIHKNKNSSSGGFNLVLKRGNKNDSGKPTNSDSINYLEVINPGDWISIYMKKDDDINLKDFGTNDKDSGLKMVGIVENVRFVEIDDPNSGKPRLEYVITGRDFGKIFENEIYYNPVISSIKGVQDILGIDFLQNSNKQFGGDKGFLHPDEVIKNMIGFYMGGSGAVKSTTKMWYMPQKAAAMLGKGGFVSGSRPFIEVLDTSRIGLQEYSNGSFKVATNLPGRTAPLSVPYSGTVWSAMKQYSNPILNEMIVDLTIKGNKIVPSVQLRQLPYSNKQNSAPYVFSRSPGSPLANVVSNSDKTFMLDLPRHEILSTDIKQKNVGKNDFERVNAIVVVPNNVLGASSQAIQEAYTMALNAASVQRYGLRLLQGNTFYTYGLKSKDVSFVEYVTKASALMSDWFMTAHLLYNGTIITDGTNDFVEVGQNLYISDVQQIFHIEGISYMYEINPDTGNTIYNTEFRVSRGQITNETVSKSDFIGNPIELRKKEEVVSVITNTLENIRNKDKGGPGSGSGGGFF